MEVIFHEIAHAIEGSRLQTNLKPAILRAALRIGMRRRV